MKHPNLPAHLFIVAGAVTMALPAQADDKRLDPKKYNNDGNPAVVSVAEQDHAILLKYDPVMAAYDVDGKAGISAAEKKAALEALSDKIDAANREAQETVADKRKSLEAVARKEGRDIRHPMAPEEFTRMIEKPEPPVYTPGWFRLRSKVSDFSTAVAKGGGVEAVGKLTPATFSLARDYDKHTNTWTASGAVGGFWSFEDRGGPALSVGAEFNRMDTNTPKKDDVDSLVFRSAVSGGSQFDTGNGPVMALGWSGGADYGTNFDFDGALLGLSGDLEAIWKTPASQTVGTLFGGHSDDSPAVNFRTTLHLEGGTEVSDLPGPSKGDDYLRVGPDLSLKVWPGGTNFPLSLTASYGYYAGLLSQDKDYRNFKGGAEWRLDQNGHLVLKVEYVDGVTPLLLQHQQSLLLSLGARF